MRLCWLFYGDAWGFAELSRRRPSDALESLRRVETVVKKLRSTHKLVDYLLLSDSILCVRDVAPDDAAASDCAKLTSAAFEDISIAVQHLIAELSEMDLLLRGAVTFGSLTREREIIFGEVLLDAAEFEKSTVAPPLAFLPASTLIKARDRGGLSNALVSQNLARSVLIPTKAGGMIRVQPLLGDRPEQLRKRLSSRLDEATISASPSPYAAAALKGAIDVVDNVLTGR